MLIKWSVSKRNCLHVSWLANAMHVKILLKMKFIELHIFRNIKFSNLIIVRNFFLSQLYIFLWVSNIFDNEKLQLTFFNIS